MAERTISIKPFTKEYNETHIKQAFAEFALEKVHVNHGKSEAYVKFEDPNDVEALEAVYPECSVPSLGNAQIGLVEADFTWPA